MLSDKVSYLRGLMDGLDLDYTTKEGKVLKLMAEILDEMAVYVEDISDEVDEVVEIVDMIDTDLCELENDFYELDEEYDDDDDDYDDFDDEEEIDFDDINDINDFEDFDEEDFDDEPMYECCCPSCGDSITISESIVEKGSMNCPNCNTLIEFDYKSEEEN